MNSFIKKVEMFLIEKDIEEIERKTFIQQLQEELKEEKYGLVWENYPEPVEELLKIHTVKLDEQTNRRIEAGEAHSPVHQLIEGDNIESLTALQTTHKGMVNVIYIDPPYNTKNNFKYSDNYGHHSKWLSFMEKRLRLAYDLLADDGVIFISIDDNEFAQLKLLCDEIFKENNFIQNFMWLHGKGKKDSQSRTLQQYILCYAKNKNYLNEWTEEKFTDYDFKNPDNDEKGEWFSGSISFDEKRSNPLHENYYSITSPSGVVWKRQWQISKDEMDKLIAKGDIYFGLPPKYDNVPRKKIRPSLIETIPSNIIKDKGTTKSAENELKLIFGFKIFDYPKPVSLIKHLINISTKDKGAIILDFFAGSGTTGHAVLELNKEDGGNRQFILCTNNENNICEEVTYERLRRVIDGYTTSKNKKVEGTGGNLNYYKVELKPKDK